jgi:phosphate-selective porin OprO and OprP
MNDDQFPISRLAVALAFLFAALPPALAQDTDRVQQLEEQLQSLTRELEEIKQEGRDNADKNAEAERKNAEQGVQQRFNEGLTFEDPRGNWSLRLSGRVQLDARYFLSPDDALANTLSLRRARLGAGVTLYKDYTVYVEGDFASGDATGITQQQFRATLAYIDLNWWKAARLRLGQFKPQIGLEQTLLDLQSDYMERGLQQNILDGNGLNYDRGIMMSGAPLPGTWYAVTVSNGTGQNLEEKQSNAQEALSDSKDITVRGVLDFAKLFSVENAIAHVGLGYKTGEVTNSPANPFTAPAARTEARGITFFNPASFNAATGRDVNNIDRSLTAFETLLSYGPSKLQGEYWIARYAGTRFVPAPQVDFAPKIRAGYITAMWLVTGESYADFYRDSIPQKIKPRNRFSMGNDGGWGAWEVGLRYSFFDGSDFSATNGVGTGQLAGSAAGVTPIVTVSTSQAKAYTAQVKWIQNVYARALVDYVHTDFDTPVVVNGRAVDHEDAVMMRFQVDF